MHYLFSARGRTALERLRKSTKDNRSLLAFDFDGTLVPLSPEPHFVKMRATTRKRLKPLTARHPVALITGRAVADVTRFIKGISFASVIGNHGIEDPTNRKSLAKFDSLVRGWIKVLSSAVDAEPGAWIEDKRFSLSLHFRESRKPKAVAKALSRRAKELRQVVVIPGKDVVNVVPRGAPHKGDAFFSLMRRNRAQMGLYVGDDVTDESVFGMSAASDENIITVRVGHSLESEAKYYLRNQREMDRLLGELIEG